MKKYKCTNEVTVTEPNGSKKKIKAGDPIDGSLMSEETIKQYTEGGILSEIKSKPITQ